MGRLRIYATDVARKQGRAQRAAERRKLRPRADVYLGKVIDLWNQTKCTTGLTSDIEFAICLLDSFLKSTKVESRVGASLAADLTVLQDDKNLILPVFDAMPVKVKQEEILGSMAPNYTATVGSTGDNASGPASSGKPAATGVPPLDMSCDRIYKVTVTLSLESDWKHPVVVSLTNATIASSEVTGSNSHQIKVINDQTLELTSLTETVGDSHAGVAASTSEETIAEMNDPVFDVSSECDDDPSECSDTPSECSDAEMIEDDRYLISGWKDDPNNDPDWDPDDNSDGEIIRKRKRAAAKKSGSGSGAGSGSGSSSDSDNDDTVRVSCQACSFRTHSRSVLTSHVMRRHYEEASLSGQRMCRQCGRVEDSIGALQQHRQANHSDDLDMQRKCPVCGEVFTSYYKYRTHVTSHEHKHKCKECKRAFLTTQALGRHNWSAHRAPPDLKNVKLVCEICGHLVDQQRKLEEHQTVKHGIDFGKRLPCAECDQVFQSIMQLRNHIRSHHRLLKPLECEVCGKSFKQEDSLRIHLENVHLQTHAQVCPYCGKKITTRTRLKKHVNNVHLRLRLLPCPWPGCTRSFGNKWHLKVHMHIHNDKKPLACPHCDFRARQRHSLDYHLERYHKDLATEQKKDKVTGDSQVSTATSDGAVNDQVTPEETANTQSNPATPEHTTDENNSETAETYTVDA